MEQENENWIEDVNLSAVLDNFIPEGDETSNLKKSLFNVTKIGEEYAQPCHVCGAQPSVHVANFTDRSGHPNNVYISCSHCSSCDGKWYASREDALEEWNRVNMGSKPKDPSKEDEYDFVNKIMKNFRIPD